MNYVYMVKRFVFIILFSTNILPLNNKEEVIQVEAIKNNSTIEVYFSYPKNYGVQVGNLNLLSLYTLKNDHRSDVRNNTNEYKISKYGTLFKSQKSFLGILSTENKKYYSSVFPIKFNINNEKVNYVLTGKIFYCAFDIGLCSVQKVDIFIP